MKDQFAFLTIQPSFGVHRRNQTTMHRQNRNICCSGRQQQPQFDPSVYLVTDANTSEGLSISQVVTAALRGKRDGKRRATVVQLRDKKGSYVDKLRLGTELRQQTLEHGACFIVNDDANLAKELGADGVHVGQDDMNVKEVRSIIGENCILGVSAGTPEEAMNAVKQGADYIGVGAVYKTNSKDDAGEPIGCEGLQEIITVIDHCVPVVAIGGINEDNASKCIEAGADGVAIVSAVMRSTTPDIAAAKLWDVVTDAKTNQKDTKEDSY